MGLLLNLAKLLIFLGCFMSSHFRDTTLARVFKLHFQLRSAALWAAAMSEIGDIASKFVNSLAGEIAAGHRPALRPQFENTT